MKILVRQISSGLYWNGETRWGQEQEAQVFADSGEAILFCIKREMRDVHVVLSFGDPSLDVVLHPFGERGHEATSKELVEQSQTLGLKNKTMTARAKALLAGMLQSVAAMKERKKKQHAFQRKQIGEE